MISRIRQRLTTRRDNARFEELLRTEPRMRAELHAAYRQQLR